MQNLEITERVQRRLTNDLFNRPIIDNNLRGIWVEYLVAESLGPGCAIVSGGWNVWDLQFGGTTAEYPERIRIQVKNTASIQTWHTGTTATSCQWQLTMRNRPAYFERQYPSLPCESYGYLCDVFVLCHHPETDRTKADHRDPLQWDFYVVPVTAVHSIFPVFPKPEGPKGRSSYTVVPASLKKGIRGRPPILPARFDQMTEPFLRQSLTDPILLRRTPSVS